MVSLACPHAGRTVQRSELPALEDACDTFARTGHRFERLEATRQQLAKLFKVRPQACPLPGMSLPQHVPSLCRYGVRMPSLGTSGTLLVGVMDGVMLMGTGVTPTHCRSPLVSPVPLLPASVLPSPPA